MYTGLSGWEYILAYGGYIWNYKLYQFYNSILQSNYINYDISITHAVAAGISLDRIGKI